MARLRRQYAFFGAAALLLSLAACHHQPADQPPPRVTGTIAIPPQTSAIAVPVVADLGALAGQLDGAVPQVLWTIDKPDQTCVAASKVKILFATITTPRLTCHLVGEVTRGPLTLSGQGRDIIVAMPIHAEIRARDIGHILREETAHADANVRAVLRLDLAPNWSPRGKITLHYTWVDDPHVDFLGKRIDFTDQADAKLAPVIARLQQSLPRQLARLNLPAKIGAAWASAFTSLELNHENPPVWMRITPQSLAYGGYTVAGRQLTLRLGMVAQTQTYVGPRPDDPQPTPLPPMRAMTQPPGVVEFQIPVIAAYRELEPVLVKALVKRQRRPFTVPGLPPVDAQFHAATIYGTTGGRIAVGLDFTATPRGQAASHGTLWLTATPTNTPGSRKVGFSDLAVSGLTDSTGGNLLVRLANAPGLSDTIADALGQNFERDYAKLLGKITRAISEKRTGGLIISAQITDIRTGKLQATPAGLYLPVAGRGTASVAIETE